MKVVVAGAGSVGSFIAEDLHKAGHEVIVLEQDADIVSRMSASIGGEWIVADACEVLSLQAAGVSDADVMVAATGDDEDNLVISLLAKQEFMIPRVIARVNHPRNEWMFNKSWGVDVAVSTPHLLSSLVEEAVSVGSLVRLLQFERSGARLVEVTLAEDSPAIDVSISQLDLPRETSVVAVLRDLNLLVPRGDTVLRAGDEVVALVTSNAEEDLRAILIGSEST